MKKTILLMMVFLFACGNSEEFTVEKQWETDPVLTTCESVLYDESRDILFVSNINGKPAEKDGNGFISKVKTNGEIVTLKWITGLNAPKGSGIFQGKFYVTDIDELVEIDVEAGEILNRYPVEDAQFLNDIAVDLDGNVYISDSSDDNSVIYKFKDGEVDVWVESDEIMQPNGLLVKDNRLLVGSYGTGGIKAINLNDQSISTVANVSSSIDGLRSDWQGNYIISNWQGKTSLVQPTGNVIELLNTTDEEINAADIEFIQEQKLLIIPTFFNDRVMAYKLMKK